VQVAIVPSGYAHKLFRLRKGCQMATNIGGLGARQIRNGLVIGAITLLQS
jgi:hypothetical protein